MIKLGNGKSLINNIKETINEKNEKNTERNDDDNKNTNAINTKEINDYNYDMNIFLGKLVNRIQNTPNKLYISV